MQLENYIRDIQGFPKEGILFKDITPLLNDPKATQECLKTLKGLLEQSPNKSAASDLLQKMAASGYGR